mmetsp:Transcript_3123/g.6909  ORF Transcript_3123/g.6909 Transcript_3123/m.6909 type:complete len:81 (-) Transcript_3123:202-444(-)
MCEIVNFGLLLQTLIYVCNSEELIINNNEMTGEVDDSLCIIRNDIIPGGNLGEFHADCQPSFRSGAPPQIVCSCCTACYV